MYASLHGLSLNPNEYSDDNPFPILLTAQQEEQLSG